MGDVDEPDILPIDPDLDTSPSQMPRPHHRAEVLAAIGLLCAWLGLVVGRLVVGTPHAR